MIKFNYFTFLFAFSVYLFSSTQAYSLTGSEVRKIIIEYLNQKNIVSDPIIKGNRSFKNCDHDLKIKEIFNDYKTVLVSCQKPLKWSLTVRTNANVKQRSLSKLDNSNNLNKIKLITLKNNLKKGEVIQEIDLQLEYKSKSVGKGFFENFDRLVGREINQNLSKGQVIKTRHLKENFMVSEGQSVIIFSNLYGINVRMNGNALENGHFNELIKVENISSGKIIQGKIINEKKILINY